MGRYLLILIVLCGLCRCAKFPDDRKTYYFYNAKQQFKKIEFTPDTSSQIIYSLKILYPRDSFRIISGGEYYELYYLPKYANGRDTFFMRQKSALDTIDYFDAEWVKNKSNLDKFWEPVKYGRGWINDTLKIYIIEPIGGTDSVIFRRVHRVHMSDID